jgi:predicted RNA-binding Zn ribbon-like protein
MLLVTDAVDIARGTEEPAVPWVKRPVTRQPGDRAPAPGDLALVQAFVNTFWDIDRDGAERLIDGSALAAWFGGYGLLEPGTSLGEADLRRALDVRGGLRALLFANNGAAVDAAAIERLNRALRGPGVFVQLGPSAPPGFSAPRRDLDGAVASIATIVALAQIDGTWHRLKACRGDHCGWAFYDHSRNQSGTWCAMSLCGARAKARDYRRRKRSSGDPEHDRAT